MIKMFVNQGLIQSINSKKLIINFNGIKLKSSKFNKKILIKLLMEKEEVAEKILCGKIYQE